MNCTYCKEISVCAICGKGYAEAVRAAARQKLIEDAITKATGAHRVLNAYDYEDVFACCEAVLAAGLLASGNDQGENHG